MRDCQSEIAESATLKDTIESLTIELTASQRLIHLAEGILSREERDRASRFRFPELHRRYTISHACLRVLLAGYLRRHPASIGFCFGRSGKPSVAGASVEFNMSHSGEMAAYAFTSNASIGVDLEHVRPLPDMLSIAGRFFGREEAAELMATVDDRRDEAFYRCWTRKESFIKALGDGLSYPLDRFRVSLAPGTPAIISIDGNEDAARQWTLYDLAPAHGYIGSIAIQGVSRQLRMVPSMPAEGFLQAFFMEAEQIL